MCICISTHKNSGNKEAIPIQFQFYTLTQTQTHSKLPTMSSRSFFVSALLGDTLKFEKSNVKIYSSLGWFYVIDT